MVSNNNGYNRSSWCRPWTFLQPKMQRPLSQHPHCQRGTVVRWTDHPENCNRGRALQEVQPSNFSALQLHKEGQNRDSHGRPSLLDSIGKAELVDELVQKKAKSEPEVKEHLKVQTELEIMDWNSTFPGPRFPEFGENCRSALLSPRRRLMLAMTLKMILETSLLNQWWRKLTWVYVT